MTRGAAASEHCCRPGLSATATTLPSSDGICAESENALRDDRAPAFDNFGVTQSPPADATQFFEQDFPASLFPLKTNLFMMRHHADGLAAHVKQILESEPDGGGLAFLTQQKSHAAKPRNHLRRTAVLDPVAMYFVYDFVFRNRSSLNPEQTSPRRKAFGYRFDGDAPVPVHTAFQEFTAEIDSNLLAYDHSLSFDIASYFNTLYRDDIQAWLERVPGIAANDAAAFIRFLSETNGGRSIDCLPQGIYPTKMIGSAFLSFIEDPGALGSDQTFRFMDDVYLFANEEEPLIRDFLHLQTLLGQKSLNINPTKTAYDGSMTSVASQLSEIQEEIDAIIPDEESSSRYFGSGSEINLFDDDHDEEHEDGGDEAAEEDGLKNLSKNKSDRLYELLLDPRAEEADVERILKVLLQNAQFVADAIPVLLQRFPNIVKQLHSVVGRIEDKEALASSLLDVLNNRKVPLLEYQLFWAATIAEDHLSKTRDFNEILLKLYQLTGSYELARAKVLEIPAQQSGLKLVRDGILNSGTSNWSAWASAIGARTLPRSERERLLKSFATASPMNRLIADCVRKMDP